MLVIATGRSLGRPYLYECGCDSRRAALMTETLSLSFGDDFSCVRGLRRVQAWQIAFTAAAVVGAGAGDIAAGPRLDIVVGHVAAV